MTFEWLMHFLLAVYFAVVFVASGVVALVYTVDREKVSWKCWLLILIWPLVVLCPPLFVKGK